MRVDVLTTKGRRKEEKSKSIKVGTFICSYSLWFYFGTTALCSITTERIEHWKLLKLPTGQGDIRLSNIKESSYRRRLIRSRDGNNGVSTVSGTETANPLPISLAMITSDLSSTVRLGRKKLPQVSFIKTGQAQSIIVKAPTFKCILIRRTMFPSMVGSTP